MPTKRPKGPRGERPAPHFCTVCGAVVGPEAEVGQPCALCGVPLSVVLTVPVSNLAPSHLLALKEAVDRKVAEGWYIVRQKENFAEMCKPKGKLNRAMLLGALAAGVPLPGSFLLFGGAYLAWHVLSGEPVGAYLCEPGRNSPGRAGSLTRRAWAEGITQHGAAPMLVSAWCSQQELETIRHRTKAGLNRARAIGTGS